MSPTEPDGQEQGGDQRQHGDDRSWYGALPLDDAEIAHLVSGGVRIFLRAYRPAAAG